MKAQLKHLELEAFVLTRDLLKERRGNCTNATLQARFESYSQRQSHITSELSKLRHDEISQGFTPLVKLLETIAHEKRNISEWEVRDFAYQYWSISELLFQQE